MKVLLLSSASSVHTIRWANALQAQGLELVLVSQHKLIDGLSRNVVFRQLKYQGELGYFLNTPKTMAIIHEESPDVIHAHYASGYGCLAANCGVSYQLSVWGSDVYDFPHKSLIHRFILKRSLRKATAIYSTSHCMREESKQYTDKPISVIPFGVDTDCISPAITAADRGNQIYIGIIKVLAWKYGIDVLLNAFQKLLQDKELNKYSMQLIVGGDGPEKSKLEAQAKALNINHQVQFLGWVENSRIVSKLHDLDIVCIPSRLNSESFGVAALEASAAGLPVVASRVGGLPETVVEGKTGLFFEKENAVDLAEKLKSLILNAAKRKRMGENGREFVLENFQFQSNVTEMIQYYKSETSRKNGI